MHQTLQLQSGRQTQGTAATRCARRDDRFINRDAGDSAMPGPAIVPTWKRVLDLTLVVIASPLLAVMALFIAAYIKVVSPGPLFFRQERIGLGGRRFVCFKFRSMRSGADAAKHQHHVAQLLADDVPMTKMDRAGDARIIPGGRLLRASGLDELAQIWNVVRGEMSLVGPRPCTPEEFQFYRPSQKARCNTLPGLTGLWQVSGKNRTTFTQMIELDIRYAQNLSLRADVNIIFRTVAVLFGQVREMSVPVGASAAPGMIMRLQ